jgi:glyoxalase family protein
MMTITGIHHVTAIVDDAQQNVDFYADLLGLRLIKRTVNFDAPDTYHLYFGDELGRPGTIMTFFPWAGAARGSNGSGQMSATAFAIPQASLDYWLARLSNRGIRHADPAQRFGHDVVSLYDPAGLLLELVARPDVAERQGWQGGGVPAEHAIRGFDGATLTLGNSAASSDLLTEVMGFRELGSEGNRTRYALGTGEAGTLVDIVSRPDLPFGRIGAGSVHHIAWRVPDDAHELTWQQKLRSYGVQVTEVRDRQYFHSIYFQEPGGVLFEIATDNPGFTLDETPEQLGQALNLPPWLESQRTMIERMLPPLTVPTPQQD